MKLIIKQQFFTLFDKFDVYDEGDNIVYTVEGQFALTKTLSVLDHDGNEAAKLTRRFFTILPTFDIEVDGGIGEDNVGLVTSSGANVIVAGSAIFHSKKINKTIKAMKIAAKENPYID